MPLVQGTCDPKFDKVKALFQKFLESGEELGASFKVNVNGEDVINLYGGYADADRLCPWEKDTIANVYSITKMVSSLSILMLFDNSKIQVNDKVSKH